MNTSKPPPHAFMARGENTTHTTIVQVPPLLFPASNDSATNNAATQETVGDALTHDAVQSLTTSPIISSLITMSQSANLSIPSTENPIVPHATLRNPTSDVTKPIAPPVHSSKLNMSTNDNPIIPLSKEPMSSKPVSFLPLKSRRMLMQLWVPPCPPIWRGMIAWIMKTFVPLLLTKKKLV
ncbi:hypothetical protein LIER_15557 [Lithospermum erythrorhizon]|uniref:Uncharacterized protein n=1 Tax=Lithospermum erythrorhizon TaxID=34254 RepID=A0AAV3Q7F8_LITER